MRRGWFLIVFMVATSLFLFGAKKKFWEDTPFTEWTAKQAQEILEKSPWAQTQDFGTLGGSGAATPTPSVVPNFGSEEIRTADRVSSRMYRVRFQSAAPIRMALARLGLLRGGVTLEKAQQFVDNAPGNGEIVVFLSVPSGQDRGELDANTTELLKNETYLILRKSKKRVPLKQYLTPSEAGGIEAILLFPRTENGKDLVTLDEKEVRFVCKLSGRTKLSRGFKLKDMMFNGKLEI